MPTIIDYDIYAVFPPGRRCLLMATRAITRSRVAAF